MQIQSYIYFLNHLYNIEDKACPAGQKEGDLLPGGRYPARGAVLATGHCERRLEAPCSDRVLENGNVAIYLKYGPVQCC